MGPFCDGFQNSAGKSWLNRDTVHEVSENERRNECKKLDSGRKPVHIESKFKFLLFVFVVFDLTYSKNLISCNLITVF